MNKVANLSDKRQLSFEQNVSRIVDIAKRNFLHIDSLKNQSFENDVWQYRGSYLYFRESAKGDKLNPFVANTIKALIIHTLWKTRLRREPLSDTRIRGFISVGRDLHAFGVMNISQITLANYETIFVTVANRSNDATRLNDLNTYIRFLNDEHALTTHIDLLKPQSFNVSDHESEDFQAIKEKMPEPELIRNIIALKHAVEENDDGSTRSQIDKLYVYTQAFQYGLGLRIGEVLRLSKDCLFEHQGKLLCRVWTEKGAEPIPRHVLADWREIITDVHGKILEITKDVRKFAEQLEETGSNDYITKAVKSWEDERQKNIDEVLSRLNLFLLEQKKNAINAWELKKTVSLSTQYTLDDLSEILPLSSAAKTTPAKVKAYFKWGLELTVTPLDKKKNRYTVSGQAILNFVSKQVELRSENLTEREFLRILHDLPIHRQNGRDKEIFALTDELPGSTATCYTFAPEDFAGKGRAPTAMTRAAAAKMLQHYARGMLEKDEMSVSDLGKYFPEIPFLYETKNIQARNKHLDICGLKRVATKVDRTLNPKTPVSWSVTSGYAIKVDSIRRYALSRFFERNIAEINKLNDDEIEDQIISLRELTPEEECKLPPTIISSKSFKAEQKVSDYLFIRPMQLTSSSTALSFIPEVISQHDINYFFKGNDRYPNAFKRYGLKEADRLSQSWQSHQGRHWRTTSLFRSGASKSLVNKYMGRSDPQGKHYDHNTGSERAQKVAEAMSENTERFVGNLPAKVAELKRRGADSSVIGEVLEKNMQTVNHGPCGYCTQSLELNPCDYHLRCLLGSDGSGCKRLVIDLDDPTTLPMLEAVRDENRAEIERLVGLRDKTGNISIDKHLAQKVKLFDNAETVIKLAKNALSNETSELSLEPFKNGSAPDDDPFQLGDD